jgi:hypothetical protein
MTVSMPTRGRVDHRLRDLLKEYSKNALDASYMFWRLGIICNHFFVWCYQNNEWPHLDPPLDANGRKTKASNSWNQTLFRNMIRLGTHPDPENQSKWEQLQRFWKSEGRQYAPEPIFNSAFGCSQLLDKAADKYRDNCITELTRSYFCRQETLYKAMYDKSNAEHYRALANGTRKDMASDDKPTSLGGAHLPPNRQVTEQFLQRNLGAAVFANAQLTEAYEALHGTGCGWSLAPIPKLDRKRMPFDSRVLFQLAQRAGALSREECNENMPETLESVLPDKKENNNHAGNQKVFDGFIDTDGITMCVHYTHKTKASKGNDNCSEELLPARVMSENEVDDKEVIGLDPGRRTIASAWSPNVSFFTLEGDKYRQLSGQNYQKQESDKRTQELQMNEHEYIKANPGKTVQLLAIRRFVTAQAETAAARWKVACKGERQLHLKFRTERLKRKCVDEYFQSIRRKCRNVLGHEKVVIMYGNGVFPSTGPGENGGGPTQSTKRACKRHFVTRSANEYRTSRSCIYCKEDDVTKVNRKDDHVFCKRCERLAGKREYVHKDKMGAMNIRRSGISEAKKRERPLDLRTKPEDRSSTARSNKRKAVTAEPQCF